MFEKIAVIGATGLLGKPVLTALMNSGYEVNALVRNPSKADIAKEAKFVKGDLRNRQALQELLAGQDGLHINLNLKKNERKTDFHAETDGLKIILDEAKKVGIKRISFISSLVMRYQGMNNFHWWVFEMKAEAIRLIKNSDIPYTIFYPSTFMDNFESNYRMGNKILLAGKSIAPMYFISAEDYGKQVARSYQILTSENKEYIVQGPEAFTADEAAAEFIKHYQKANLSVMRAPLSLMKILGKFSPQIDYGCNIIEAMNNYPEKFVAEDTWRMLGKPQLTLRRYAEKVSGIG